MRRRPDTLIPIEVAILAAGTDLRRAGLDEFHGFLLAKELQERADARRLIDHGTLYKALGRLERSGLLASRWEDPAIAAAENRPRRRLYAITISGEHALASTEVSAPPLPRAWVKGVAAT